MIQMELYKNKNVNKLIFGKCETIISKNCNTMLFTYFTWFHIFLNIPGIYLEFVLRGFSRNIPLFYRRLIGRPLLMRMEPL